MINNIYLNVEYNVNSHNKYNKSYNIATLKSGAYASDKKQFRHVSVMEQKKS